MADFERGQPVLGRFRGGDFWFAGVVESAEGGRVSIQYDDGDRETVGPEQVRPFDWAVGSRIEAVWSGNGQWYAATITEIDSGGSRLTVRFDDGIVEQTVTGRCRADARGDGPGRAAGAGDAADLQAGQWVLGRWRSGSHWFPAVVESIRGDLVELSYADGDRETLPAALVRPLDWRVGSRVSAVWSGNGLWYAATVTETGPGDDQLTVRFDDGIVEQTVVARCRSE